MMPELHTVSWWGRLNCRMMVPGREVDGEEEVEADALDYLEAVDDGRDAALAQRRRFVAALVVRDVRNCTAVVCAA
jgi:hypothetical protein|eukprot:4972288-Prymnesium_polylepis.1